MKFIKLLFLTRQNFLHNVQTGGYQVSKSLFQCCEKNTEIELSLCIFDIDGGGSSFKNSSGCHTSNVKIVAINNNPVKRNISYLFLRSGYSIKENQIIKDVIKKSNADMIFFDGTWFGRIVKFVGSNTKKIVFCHNIEKEFALNRLKKTKKVTAIPRFFSDWYNERCVIKRADKIVCLNNRDSTLLNKNYGRYADLILSIMLDDKYDGSMIVKRQSNMILFVGSFFYANVEGIQWFCKNVMPFVGCDLYIVGKGMEVLKEELEDDRINVIGTVNSLSEYYNEADVVVLPIFSGGGMKVKTAEAMMYGKKILASNEALEGYRTEGSKDIIRCNTAEEFIDGINYFVGAKKLSKYSESNRKIFLKYYSISSAYEQINKLIRELMNEKN